MHFFGSLGLISFLLGFLSASYLILQKLYDIYVVNMPITRDVTNNTWFYLALTAVVIGVQLFLAGYLAEMMTINSINKNDYIVTERIGF